MRAPGISVVIEGYNELHGPGELDDTMSELERQAFDLADVEVVLVGSAAQVEEWKKRYGEGTPFHRVEFVAADGAQYYELKSRGAAVARGAIIAFLDSDAPPTPGWLAAVAEGIERGADAVAGLSLFRPSAGVAVNPLELVAAACISWGYVVGNGFPNGLVAHNVAFRAEVFRSYGFRSDLGRSCGGWFLYCALKEGGARLALQADQRTGHVYSLGWWLRTLHLRMGYEVWRQRRLDPRYPHRWVVRTGPFEPLLTMTWRVARDVPQWWRFAKALGLTPSRRLGMLPLVVPMALAARGAEAAGMYASMLDEPRMQRFAETH
jgi:glycosyltransferase involved in cell wall biosynthesis